MLTDYDIQRLSSAIVDNLVNNDKFISRITKAMPKRRKFISSSKAAELLGITRKTVCEIAPYLGGVKTKGTQAHWIFEEEGIQDRYLNYKNNQ